MVADLSSSGACFDRQVRMATISACAVGSALRLPVFCPRASTSPPLTMTAPKG